MKLRIFGLLCLVALFCMGVTYTIDSVKAPTTSGVTIQNNSGGTVATFGSSGGTTVEPAANVTMANGSTLTAETIKPVDSTGVVIDINASKLQVQGNVAAAAGPAGMYVYPTLTNTTNGYGYSLLVNPYGTTSTQVRNLWVTDSNLTSTGTSYAIYGAATKGTSGNYGYYTGATGTVAASNTGGYFYCNGKTAGVQTGVQTSVYGSMGGVQNGGVFVATIGSGTPTECYGIKASGSGGSSANYDLYLYGTKNIALGDGNQVIKGNTSDDTIRFGTNATDKSVMTMYTATGNVTLNNNSVLTAETVSPVDTTGILLNGSTNFVKVANDGNMTFAGTATYWDDVLISGLSVQTAGSADPALTAFPTGSPTKLYAFSATADNEVFATIQLPHKYREGSNIGLHVHWSPETASTDDVVWGLDWTWANVLATPAAFAASTNALVTADAGNLQWGHQIAGWTDLTGTSKTISSCLVLRVYRDADNGADTYTGKAFLISIDAHVECDSLGSNDTITK